MVTVLFVMILIMGEYTIKPNEDDCKKIFCLYS